ncbi:TIGR02677 family protein [Vagococcus carniphilus]|uniref:TIGR02677 family protein n=1 Tax=Vagococcus carniphilus TaxID=218144 RepID=UPI0028907AE6|nr:TIGR02677 family protein [Vagococcus carniphilus]MDT2848284.1 TIGR02677 family protein [Vagococcus carniphilus]
MTEKIWAANYLTVQHVERYRKIMRFFYKKHRQMQGTMYRPDILKMMQSEFSENYGELEVDQDLENLVAWGNLHKQQEMIRPRSIEEYRNKNFRFQITEEGVLVEEMVYQITTKKHVARGALDEKSINKLLALLEEFVTQPENKMSLWLEIRKEFRSVGEDTANYIGYITSPEVDSQMKTEQFLIYKDKFVNYLRDFISSIQSLQYPFIKVVTQLQTIDQTSLIDDLLIKEQEVPTMDDISREEIEEQVLGEMEALRNWFIGSSSRPSEFENLMIQTDQMIRKITELIYYFSQEIHQYQSRRKDYIQIANWFYEADSLEDTQKMFAGIFGAANTRHFYVSEGSDAVSTRDDSWELEPSVLYLSKRGRGARKERKASSFTIDKKKQLERLKEYQLMQETNQKKIESYFKEDLLDFEKIACLDSYSRSIFLRWIGLAFSSYLPQKQKKSSIMTQRITTEFDFTVEVLIDKKQRILVNCEDGQLEMPKIVMKR